MTTKYLYLDDEPPAAVRPYVRAVTAGVADLAIEHLPPKPYPEQIPLLRERCRDGGVDGLILDLRLDQHPDWQNGTVRADYRASTLAQEIRTRATEGNLPEFPIVLWSTDERLRRSYVNDDTSHDLFDLKSVKEAIEQPDGAREIGLQLTALVEGYRQIQQVRGPARGRNRGIRLLGFTEAPAFLDERILSAFEGRSGTQPTHEIARFILRQVLERAGPLLSRKLLAARLGIDLSRSTGFDALSSEFLSKAEYVGAFASGWPRWWAAEVEGAWRSMTNVPGPLRTCTAEQRVAALKAEFKVRGLSAATPLPHARSTAFWTICEATGAPLDPREGFLADTQPIYAWQDRVYLSLASLVDGTAKMQRLRIDPLENERFSRARRNLKAQ